MNLHVAEVILDDALNQSLDYLIPQHLVEKIVLGSRVLVPVRTSRRQGTVVTLKGSSPWSKLESILEVLLEAQAIPSDLFALAKWISAYYAAPLRKVLKTLLPPSIRGKSQVKTQLFIKPNVSKNEMVSLCTTLRNKSPKQAAILDALLLCFQGMLLSKLIETAQVSASSVKTLIEKGILLSQSVQIDRTLLTHAEYLPTRSKQLNPLQQEALKEITQDLEKETFQTRLLHGITGSGKTEVYLQAMDCALQRGKGVIFLVPEIALTSQMIEKLKGRFQERVAILHYRLSLGERFDAWHEMRKGNIRIAVGARSAIFSPIQNVGLIIVDEEHESSYKQSEEAPCYHARDVAVMRGKLTQAVVLLGSATPSLESYYNATTGKYALSTLSYRASNASLPEISIIDMRAEVQKNKGSTLFSSPLIDALTKRIEKGEQSLLFLNRRGYHTLQMCTHCGESQNCPHCDTHLTFHLGDNLLACHLCDFRISPLPRCCSHCKAEDSLKFKGVGTERVERTLHALLPGVRTLRIDADTTRHKGSHELLFKQFRSGKADVLIGTQMVAKGLHFPQVTLVAVLNADSSLQVPDFRASETTFQLLTQVAGRSGRGFLKGEVLIQTFLPEHPLIALAKNQDYLQFAQEEIHIRKLFHYPPFTHLVKLTFKGAQAAQVEAAAQKYRARLIARLPPQFEILPVVAAGHAKIKGSYLFQFLIKAEKLTTLLTLLQNEPASERLCIDVDPLSTFF